ncbi:transposase [Spirosoma panaciterrae]|uniref:transposase n=1 Tax=Spirosoma panaciterrae TaxID=496058 RepID=UPI00035F9FD0|nr:transposase [Spirosoma panaciterrae]
MVKRPLGGPCAFDEAFREMAVELSYAKGSIQEAARELGVDPGRISKWRQRHKKTDQNLLLNSTLTDEQQQIRRLQRELREAQMDRMAEATRYNPAVSIFSKTDGKCSDL